MDEVSPQVSKPSGAGFFSRRTLVIVAVAAVALLAAYITGRVQTSSSIDAAEQRATAAASKAEQTERVLRGAQQKLKRLEARRLLHQALLSLDERNFGIAQEQLSGARALLASGASDHPLSELTKPISEYRLLATEDLGAQRAQVLQWVRRFDALSPPDTSP